MYWLPKQALPSLRSWIYTVSNGASKSALWSFRLYPPARRTEQIDICFSKSINFRSSGKLVTHAEAPLHPWKGPRRDAREGPYVQAWQLDYDFLSGCAPKTKFWKKRAWFFYPCTCAFFDRALQFFSFSLSCYLSQSLDLDSSSYFTSIIVVWLFFLYIFTFL